MSRKGGAICGMLALALGVGNPMAAAQSSRSVAPGSPIESELSPGRVDAYPIELSAGQFLHVVVEQNHLDASVRILSASGAELAQADNAADESDPVTVSAVSPRAESCRIEIRLRNDKSPRGRYRLSIDAPRPATPEDSKRIDAERARSAGDALLAQATEPTSRQALQKYEEAIALWRAIGDRREEAACLDRVTDTLGWLGDFHLALDRARQALALWREVGDRRGESSALDEVGVALLRTGDQRAALENLGQALAIRREDRDVRGLAETLSNIGGARSALGDYPDAVARYSEAIDEARAFGDRAMEAAILRNRAVNLEVLGELERAQADMDVALARFRDLGNRHMEGVTLYSLGTVCLDRGDAAGALRRYRLALPLLRDVGDRNAESATVSHIGLAELAERRPKAALAEFETARAMQHAVGDRRHEASAVACIARARLEMGDAAGALDAFREALPMIRATGDRGTEAIALVNLARADRALGNLDAARHDIEDALRFTESTRGAIPALGERALYLAATHERYDLLIDILMDLDAQEPDRGWSAEALHASERSKARSLVDFLAAARIDLRQSIDPALLEREKSIESQIEARRRLEAQRLAGTAPVPPPGADERPLDALLAEHDEIQGKIRAADPRFAALERPQPLTAREIQDKVLDPDTVLLEYALGEKRSFVWAVTAGRTTSRTLPSRRVVEAAARRFAAACSDGGNDPAATAKAAAALGGMLLGPVAREIRHRRIAIVPEGALLYVPFAALPSPGSGDPLLAGHEIVSVPSATTLAVLRREAADRAAPGLRVAVLADPVFDRRDPRVLSGSASPATARRGDEDRVTRSIQDAGLARLDRLGASRREAEAIGALAGARRTLMALDFRASRATAMSADVASAGIVHFASHAILDGKHPELSGIVLSLVDERGDPVDGFLQTRDVYSLRLSANLVVLSACQTAVGKEVRGEGLLGLSRGFMYAGAPRIVATLWKVPDRATAELMKRFYEAILTEGLRPAAALRAAQRAIRQERRWASPYYWAAFTLQGDWN
ncbi:MAG TPA: CHAT domain-containing tetratricopeptide repeat protein [Thermoanaerobaculia bacterium]|nr:CHAT domain-containing tetratricopeptide repeat protein [Thermoanaerobaculia bacterium]